jgi:formylglycine-generating enzyme required for sulfatase activity
MSKRSDLILVEDMLEAVERTNKKHIMPKTAALDRINPQMVWVLLAAIMLLPAVVIAQQPASCCQIAKNRGQQAFDKKDYTTAISHWTKGKECPDAAKCPDLDALIKKARDEQQKQKDAAAAEQTRQREAERQRQAAEQERLRREAVAKAADDAYDIAKAANTKAAYQAFLNKYPKSRHATDAKKHIAEIDKALQSAPATTTPSSATPTIPPTFAFIKGGTFDMGCTAEQKDCLDAEKTVTRVTVSDFYLGKYELTVREFQQFINATGYKTDADKDGGSYFWTGSTWEKKSGVNWKCDAAGNIRPSSEYEHPVIHVSWNDAIAYCNWRSEKEGLSKAYTISGDKVTANWNANGYRLPTEAEWEYAARGGGKAVLFGNGKNIADPSEINFFSQESAKKTYSVAGNYRGKTVPVGSLNSPNALGLHDMSGNVWEWCWDWFDSSYYAKSNNSRDPRGPDSGSFRVLRGGSWNFYPLLVRVAVRDYNAPGLRDNGIGFRLARTP